MGGGGTGSGAGTGLLSSLLGTLNRFFTARSGSNSSGREGSRGSSSSNADVGVGGVADLLPADFRSDLALEDMMRQTAGALGSTAGAVAAAEVANTSDRDAAELAATVALRRMSNASALQQQRQRQQLQQPSPDQLPPPQQRQQSQQQSQQQQQQQPWQQASQPALQAAAAVHPAEQQGRRQLVPARTAPAADGVASVLQSNGVGSPLQRQRRQERSARQLGLRKRPVRPTSSAE
jgi:hypothetical protein